MSEQQREDISPEEASYLEWRDELRADPEYEELHAQVAAEMEAWLRDAEEEDSQTKRPQVERDSRIPESSAYRHSVNKTRDRMVYQRSDGKWVNKRADAHRASSVHDTQNEAVNAARQMLKNQKDGELTIKGRNGQIRSKDTIAPGHNPHPPKDKEH